MRAVVQAMKDLYDVEPPIELWPPLDERTTPPIALFVGQATDSLHDTRTTDVVVRDNDGNTIGATQVRTNGVDGPVVLLEVERINGQWHYSPYDPALDA